MMAFTVSMCGCTSNTVADESNPSSASESSPIMAEKANTAENNEDEMKYKTIKDMWGREVKIKKDVKNVVLIDFTGTYINIMDNI